MHPKRCTLSLFLATKAVTLARFKIGNQRVYIALQDSAKIFASRDHYYLRESIGGGRGGRVYTFNNIAPCRYAVALFHDENGNDDIYYTFWGNTQRGLRFF